MSSSFHDAWLKTALGLDVGAAAPGTALPVPGPDNQSQVFYTNFESVLGPLDEALVYVGANAEASQATGIGGKRIGLVAQYQQAAGKIDPADESKAKPDIEQALGQARAVAAEATAAKAAVEKALANWKAQEPQGEAADDQVTEMVEWGHPKAPPLRAPLDAVLAQATARRYTEASDALVAYLPTLKPVWDDYQVQKAAEAEYDAAAPELQRRAGETQKSQHKSLEAPGQAITAAQGPMETDAGVHDYVGALAKQKVLAGKVSEYEKAMETLTAQKTAYDAAVAALTINMDVAKAAKSSSLVPMQKEMETEQLAVDEAGQEEEYVKGAALAEALSTKAGTFNETVKRLEREKKEYDDAMGELRPRLTAVGGWAFKQLVGEQKGLEADGTAIEDCGTKEDYAGGIVLAGPLRTRLDAFEKTAKALEEQKKAFDTGRSTLKDKLDEAARTPHLKLASDKTTIDAALVPMDKAAADGDYDTAGPSLADTTTKVEAYLVAGEALDEEKAAFDGSYGALKKKLDDFNVTSTGPMSSMLDDIHKGQTAIEGLAEKEEYAEASKQVEVVDKQFEAFKAANDQVMYSLEWGGTTYVLNEKELAALKARVFRIIMDGFRPLESQAGFFEGVFNDMRTLNNNNLIISFVVETAGRADFGPVTQAMDAQKSAIAVFVQAAANEPKNADAAFKAAVTAVNTAGELLFTYREKLFTGGDRAIKVGLFIEAVSFGIFAAVFGAALVAGGVGVVVAGAVSSGAAALLESSAQQGCHVFDEREYNWASAGKAIVFSTFVSAMAGAAGGKLGNVLAPKVTAAIAVKLSLDEAGKAALQPIVEAKIGTLVQSAAANSPALLTKDLTIGEFAVIVAGSAIGAGIGTKIVPGLKGMPVK